MRLPTVRPPGSAGALPLAAPGFALRSAIRSLPAPTSSCLKRRILAVLFASACERAPCVPPDFRSSECRVQAENELARGFDSTGVEVRFQDPATEGIDSWVANGLIRQGEAGGLTARVATLGEFRLSVHRGQSDATSLLLEVGNVHPLVAPLTGEIARRGLVRMVEVALTAPVVEVEGRLPATVCDTGFELAAVGDVQTGPQTFQRIIDDLHREAFDAATAGTPLLGLLLLGDLAEDGTQAEFDRIAEILASSPVPTAVTPGNHDIYASDQPLFNQNFGPGTYAFDVCNARVVMVDSGNADLAASVQGWLPQLLDTDRQHLVLGTHVPPFAARTTNGWRREDQAEHLMAELADRHADALLAGHIHFRLAFEDPPIRELIVGTGGASQTNVQADYGYLRAVFRDGLDACYLPLPPPGSPGPPPGREPPTCGARR